MFFSIAIPTYEMYGMGKNFLQFNFDILHSQTFQDFEIIISDNSDNNDIQNLCNAYSDKLNIKYFKNPIKSMSGNLNNAIQNSNGEFIKILFQDDFLYEKNSLLNIYEILKVEKNIHWLVTATEHFDEKTQSYFRPFYPHYNNFIVLGNNTISCPSVLTIKNTENNLMFDENLTWLMDVDYYERLYRQYGLPKCLNTINVVNRISDKQSSSIISEEIKFNELNYILTKYRINVMI